MQRQPAWFPMVVLAIMLAAGLSLVAIHTDPTCDQRIINLAAIHPEAAQSLANELVCTLP